mmetsp:Transcript_7495/g.33875  ORF Transcript_7495/g.33875 Transcript_7495/m.33875 type:complete len:337 (-) Transcript_7495:746-1756(-)
MALAPRVEREIHPRVERPGRVHRLHPVQKFCNLKPVTLDLVDPLDPVNERRGQSQPLPPRDDLLKGMSVALGVRGALRPGVEPPCENLGVRAREVSLRAGHHHSLSHELGASISPSRERPGQVHRLHSVREFRHLQPVGANLVDPIHPIVERRRQRQATPPTHDLIERVSSAFDLHDGFSPRVESLGDGRGRRSPEVSLRSGQRFPLPSQRHPALPPSSERGGRVHDAHPVHKLRQHRSGTPRLVRPIDPVVERRRELQFSPPGHDFAKRRAMPHVAADGLAPRGERTRRGAVREPRQAPPRPRREYPSALGLRREVDPSSPRGDGGALAQAVDAP